MLARSSTQGGRHPYTESCTETFHRYCVLGHSANAEDTILAGRPVASPKAPPYGSLGMDGRLVGLPTLNDWNHSMLVNRQSKFQERA